MPKWDPAQRTMTLIPWRQFTVKLTKWNHLNGKHFHRRRPGTISCRYQLVVPLRRKYRANKAYIFLWVTVGDNHRR